MAKKKAPENYWNHRVFKEKDGEDDYYFIREVHYTKGKPVSYTENAVGPHGSTPGELLQSLAWMKAALDKPILTEEDFK